MVESERVAVCFSPETKQLLYEKRKMIEIVMKIIFIRYNLGL